MACRLNGWTSWTNSFFTEDYHDLSACRSHQELQASIASSLAKAKVGGCGGSRLIKWGVKVPAALAISGNAVVQRKWREASWAKLESDIISSRLCVDGQWWPMITDIEAVLGSCYIKRLGLCFLPNAVLPWGLRLKIEPWQEGSTFEAIMLCPVQRLQTLQTVLKICKICIFFKINHVFSPVWCAQGRWVHQRKRAWATANRASLQELSCESLRSHLPQTIINN